MTADTAEDLPGIFPAAVCQLHQVLKAGLSQVLGFGTDGQAAVPLGGKALKHLGCQFLRQAEGSGLAEIAPRPRQAGIRVPDGTEILRGKGPGRAAAEVEDQVVEFQRKRRHAAVRQQPSRPEIRAQAVGDEAVPERGGALPRRQLHRGSKGCHTAVIQNADVGPGAAERLQHFAQAAELCKLAVIAGAEAAAEAVGLRGLAAENAVLNHDIGKADADGVEQQFPARAAQLFRRAPKPVDLLINRPQEFLGRGAGRGVPVVLAEADQLSVYRERKLDIRPADVHAAEHPAFGLTAAAPKPPGQISAAVGILSAGRDIGSTRQHPDRKRRQAFRGAETVGNVDDLAVAPALTVGGADSEGLVKGRDQVFRPPVCRVGKKAQGLSAADRQQIIDKGKKVFLGKAALVLAFPARQKAVHVQHTALHKLQADRKQDGFGVRGKVGAEVRHPDSLAGRGLFDPFGKHAHFPSHSMPGADAPGMSCFICIDL